MSLKTNVESLATRIATEFKAIRTLISGSGTGTLSGLTTTTKTSLVAAINEVKAASGTPAAASETVQGIIEIATLTEVSTGTDAIRAVTPQGVRQEINAVKSAILNGAPTALDTLVELSAALGNDANFATTVTNSLANKQPLDADLTAIAALVSAANKVPYATAAGTWALADFSAAGRALVDDADVAAQRATLSVYSQAEIGDPETNFVTVFEAGLV